MEGSEQIVELPMTNEEICARYRQAKDKGDQVQILAELNACQVERIIGILVANGVDNRNFNGLRHKLKLEEAKAEKKAKSAADKRQAAKAEVAEKMQEVLYSGEKNKKTKSSIPKENAADKQQGFEDIDLISVGGQNYEDAEIIDILGRKVHALIDHRRELVAELEDIDAILSKYAYMAVDVNEIISCEGVEV